ncbi:unnamed protein product [Penicillium salamii]|nr:unnamed protein product [Penicillium salamii]CAG8346554.1 unnamed protein product [Penicillium salamii]
MTSDQRLNCRAGPQGELANRDVGQYFESSRDQNPAGWQSKPEIPDEKEILGTENDGSPYIILLPNIIDGPWQSKEKYLEAHYRLLREDAVSPLRDAVALVRDAPERRDERGLAVYESVYVRGVTMNLSGLAIHVCFSTRRAGKEIAWASSDRLRPGTLVALSPLKNAFKSKCVVGVVAFRLLDEVQKDPPEVDIYLASYRDFDVDTQKEWIMVEARLGYFEETRHAMKALQKMSTEKFPLNETICGLSANIGAPEYIQSRPTLNFESLAPTAGEDPPPSYSHDVTQNWPASPMAQLDETQWSALKEMVTKELSLTHGPPGTGKTHISLKALQLMLANKDPKDPPIIVAAQTNHALDQLLKLISEFEPNFVRLGSRSGEPKIRERTIYELRRKNLTPTVVDSSLPSVKKRHEALCKRIVKILEPLSEGLSPAGSPSNPIRLVTFVKWGLLTVAQAQSLSLPIESRRWQTARHRDSDNTNQDPFIAWLADAVGEFQYPSSNYRELDEDDEALGVEELQEIDKENLDHEAEWTILVGHSVPFAPDVVRNKMYQHALQDSLVKEHLESDNLWDIPLNHRGAVYEYLRRQVVSIVNSEVRLLQEEYEKNVADFLVSRCERDYPVLRNANVVGMTTTGLSKNRAGHVIEAPVAVACLPSVQQLILMGDHRQMRGHCTTLDLAMEPFHLETSLFERLIDNGLPLQMLKVQRRMIPEISAFVTPLYNHRLIDHPSVENRPYIPGMGRRRTFWFSHDKPEGDDRHASYVNEFEAVMVIGLLHHLLLNGVSPQDITILTFYQGQRRLLRRLKNELPRGYSFHVDIATVDSYQGEENRIILLSMVRSNMFRGIGFTALLNRACVALSRARDGLFIFGDAECIGRDSDFWRAVICQMMHCLPRRIGPELPVYCDLHEAETLIREPFEWLPVNVGCNKQCGRKQPCGHRPEHDWVSCEMICHKLCTVCDVPCSKRCSPPRIHQCHCNQYTGDLTPPGPLKWEYGKVEEQSDSVSEAESEVPSERGPYSKPRAKTSGRRDIASEAPATLKNPSVRITSDAKTASATKATPASKVTPTPKRRTPVRGPATHRVAARKAAAGYQAAAALRGSTTVITKEQTQEGLKKWKNFAEHGAIVDDYRRAGLPVPDKARGTNPGSAAPQVSALDPSMPSGLVPGTRDGTTETDETDENDEIDDTASERSEGSVSDAPKTQEEILIDLD